MVRVLGYLAGNAAIIIALGFIVQFVQRSDWRMLERDVGFDGAIIVTVLFQSITAVFALLAQLVVLWLCRPNFLNVSARFVAALAVVVGVDVGGRYVFPTTVDFTSFSLTVAAWCLTVYVLVALVGGVRPNNSFKPKPLRGSA